MKVLKIQTTIFLLISIPHFLFSQQPYSVRQDPKNQSRKIIQLPKATRSVAAIVQNSDVLDVSRSRQKVPIQFIPFEMKNPKTGKALNPDAVVKIKTPDGKERTTTVKQFFDNLNAFEKVLNEKGRSIRVANALSDLKPQFTAALYAKNSKINPGFNEISFKSNTKPTPYTSFYNTTVIANKNPIVTGYKNTNTLKLADWSTALYIADRFEDHGTTEFPAEWVPVSSADKGRKKFPVLLQVPKGFEKLITRIVWQISDNPFDGTLKDADVPGIKLSGVSSPVNWVQALRGVDALPSFSKYMYTSFTVNIGSVESEPADLIKPFFVRAVCYSQSGSVLKISKQVIASYGSIKNDFKIALPERHTVPGFYYAFPESNTMPFGVVIKGGGLSTVKATEYKNGDFENLLTKGFKITASAALSIRYFNFLSIVNSSEPQNKELEVIKAQFSGISGMGTSPSGGNEPNGINLNISALDGTISYPVSFTEMIPGTNRLSLNYTVKQDLGMQLVDTRFFIGPVPIRITANLTGEAGVDISGEADLGSFLINGSIRPYINTSFNASGGVDAIIAYATLNAEVNPLLSLAMPMTFNSKEVKPISFSNNVSGLGGRIYLKVGFYYPCPSLEKIIGWLSGEEEVPLCECVWEYNIFDFKGFEYVYSY